MLMTSQMMLTMMGSVFEDTAEYDIDYPLDMIEVNAARFNRGPRLSYEQWQKLPEDARKNWDMLSQEAKTIILNYKPPSNQHNPGQQRKFVPQKGKHSPLNPRSFNEHDIATILSCLHDLHGGSSPTQNDDQFQINSAISAPEDQVDDQPLLAHVTKRKPLIPGNIKRLLSPPTNNSGRSIQPPGTHDEVKKP